MSEDQHYTPSISNGEKPPLTESQKESIRRAHSELLGHNESIPGMPHGPCQCPVCSEPKTSTPPTRVEAEIPPVKSPLPAEIIEFPGASSRPIVPAQQDLQPPFDTMATVSVSYCLTVQGTYCDAPGSYQYVCRVFPHYDGEKIHWHNGVGELLEIPDGDILRPFTDWFAWYRKVM